MSPKIDITRHIDFCDPFQNPVAISVVGAGSLGGPLVMSLVSHGFESIEIWDDDKLLKHNIPNQVGSLILPDYAPAATDIGKFKVDVLQQHVYEKSGTRIRIHKRKATRQDAFGTVMFLAVDDMEVRRELVQAACKQSGVKLLVEARTAPLNSAIYTIEEPSNQVFRRQVAGWFACSDYPSKQVPEGGCGRSQSLPTTARITAERMVNQLVHWLALQTAKSDYEPQDFALLRESELAEIIQIQMIPHEVYTEKYPAGKSIDEQESLDPLVDQIIEDGNF